MKQLGKRIYNNNFFKYWGGRPPFYSDLSFYSKERIDEFVKNKLDATGDSDAYLTVDPTIDIINLAKYKPYTVIDGWNTVTFKTIEGDRTFKVISNVTQLSLIRTTLDLRKSNYIMDSNIEFNKTIENNFTPIGNDSGIFYGAFNANGHTISGLNINLPTTDYVGLFGHVRKDTSFNPIGGIVSNLKVIDSIITGRLKVACICGNCYFATISNCSACCDVIASERSGMIVGEARSGVSILNCNTGANCSVSSSVLSGGLVGYITNGVITNCYSTCAVNGRGLVGSDGNNTVITNSYWDTQTSGTTISDGGTGLTTEQMKLQASYEPEWDFETVWNIDDSEIEPINNGYPYLRNLNDEYVSPFGTLTNIVVTTITIDGNKYVVFPDNILINVGTEEAEDLVPLFDRSNSTLYTSDANDNAIDWLGIDYEYYWRIDKLNTANILSWMQPDYKFSWFVKNTFTEGTLDPITIKEIMAYNAPITGADNLSKMMKYLNLPEVV